MLLNTVLDSLLNFLPILFVVLLLCNGKLYIIKNSTPQARHEAPVRPSLGKRPEVIDDLVRNFLVRTRMLRTLETFQTEWCVFA